jgi:hypothetical protein
MHTVENDSGSLGDRRAFHHSEYLSCQDIFVYIWGNRWNGLQTQEQK